MKKIHLKNINVCACACECVAIKLVWLLVSGPLGIDMMIDAAAAVSRTQLLFAWCFPEWKKIHVTVQYIYILFMCSSKISACTQGARVYASMPFDESTDSYLCFEDKFLILINSEACSMFIFLVFVCGGIAFTIFLVGSRTHIKLLIVVYYTVQCTHKWNGGYGASFTLLMPSKMCSLALSPPPSLSTFV